MHAATALVAFDVRPLPANRRTEPQNPAHKPAPAEEIEESTKPVAADHPNPQTPRADKTASVFTQPGSASDLLTSWLDFRCWGKSGRQTGFI